MTVNDPVTGLAVATPLRHPLVPGSFPSQEEVNRAFEPLILSASGWRKVFAPSAQEEDSSEDLVPADRVLAAGMALVYGRWLQKTSGKANAQVLLGLDSRPTGPLIGDIMARVFLSLGLKVEYLFIIAAPEIMAYSKVKTTVDGFAYVSASHNPVGHNGVKFGLNTGGVLSAAQVNPLIEDFRTLISTGAWKAELESLDWENAALAWGQSLSVFPEAKKAAEKAYRDFTLRVVTGLEDPQGAKDLWGTWQSLFSETPVGVLSEFNGSARCLSIDTSLLEEAGIPGKRLNDRPRQFVHRIVPEGESLELCRKELENLWKTNPAYLFGYVPDCDGDRGNVVYMDEAAGQAKILEAQEVFALAVLSELACSRYLRDRGLLPDRKAAVVVNDATSRRIEDLATALGAQVFRCEVGEANVVNRAQELRSQGWEVRVLGEGSNGGNILHPAAVRDPLNTLFSFLKLVNLRSDEKGPGLFEIWCRAAGKPYRPDFSLSDVLATLPTYITTSAYEPEALLKISSGDHGLLKARYETLFLKEWEEKKADLSARHGIASYRQVNYEGTQEKLGWGSEFRSGKQRGGFKIEFLDSSGTVVAFNWMRGSGTEPVFRILTDARGTDPALERTLREWHTSLVLKADKP